MRNHDIAEFAERSGEIVLTFDEDFLRLRPELKTRVKVIYIKTHPLRPSRSSTPAGQMDRQVHWDACARKRGQTDESWPSSARPLKALREV